MAEAAGSGWAIAEVVRDNGRTTLILPEGWQLEYALYRLSREGRSLILEPVEEGPRAAAVFERLDFDGGRWIVAGTRMPAAALLEMLAHGASPESVVELCPHLSLADIRACLALGADLVGRAIQRPER